MGTVSRDEEVMQKVYAAVEAARDKPYVIGQHDCALFVVGIVKEMTGRDYSDKFKGKYKTMKGSLKVIRRLAGPVGTLEQAVTNILSINPLRVSWAMRGSPVLYIEDEQEHLGICLGDKAAVLHEEGLKFIPLHECKVCWNI